VITTVKTDTYNGRLGLETKATQDIVIFFSEDCALGPLASSGLVCLCDNESFLLRQTLAAVMKFISLQYNYNLVNIITECTKRLQL